MEGGNVILYDKFLQENFTPEEIVFWYSNGCWDGFCKGDCIDPTCARKFFNGSNRQNDSSTGKL